MDGWGLLVGLSLERGQCKGGDKKAPCKRLLRRGLRAGRLAIRRVFASNGLALG